MDTHPSLPPELWERTPSAIRAYIETLDGQVQTLTSMIHTFQEQVRKHGQDIRYPSAEITGSYPVA